MLYNAFRIAISALKHFSHCETFEKVLFALWNTRESTFRTVKYSRKCFSHYELLEEILFAFWNTRESVFHTVKQSKKYFPHSKKCFSYCETIEKLFFTFWNTRESAFRTLKKCISHFEILEGVLFTLWNKRKMFEKVFQLFFHVTLNHLGSGFYIPPALTSLRPKFFGFFGTLNGSHITPLKYTSRHYTYRDIGFSLDPGGIHSPVYLWGVSQTLEPCYPPSVFRHNFGVHFVFRHKNYTKNRIQVLISPEGRKTRSVKR